MITRIAGVASSLLLSIPTSLLLLLGLLWALGGRTGNGPLDRRERARALVRSLLWVVGALLIARLLQTALFALDPEISDAGFQQLGTVTEALAATVVLLGIVMSARGVARLTCPRRAIWQAGAVAIGAAATLLLPFAANSGFSRESALDDLLQSAELTSATARAVLLGAATLVCVAVGALLLATVWRAYVAGLPERWMDRADAVTTRGWRIAAAIGFGVFAVVAFAYEPVIELRAAVAQQALPVDFTTLFEGRFGSIAWIPGQFVITMGQAAVYVLPPAAGIAAAYWLMTQPRGAMPWPAYELTVRDGRILGVLFAAGVVVAGTRSANVLPAALTAPPVGNRLTAALLPALLGLVALGAVILLRRVATAQARGLAAQDEVSGSRLEQLRATLNRGALRRARRRKYDAFLAGEPLETDPKQSPAPAKTVGLESGPAATWQGNALVAVRRALPLAVLPVLYVTYQELTHMPRELSSLAAVAPVYLVSRVLSEVLFWLAVALTLGALFAYLPGRNGPTKGGTLGVLVAIPHIAAALVLPGHEPVAWWLFTVAEVIVFGMVLGFMLDLASIRPLGIYWRHLLDIYELRTIQSALAYGLPLAVSVAAIVAHLAAGRGEEAAGELVKSAQGLK